jgi:hypothetical protein
MRSQDHRDRTRTRLLGGLALILVLAAPAVLCCEDAHRAGEDAEHHHHLALADDRPAVRVRATASPLDETLVALAAAAPPPAPAPRLDRLARIADLAPPAPPEPSPTPLRI